MDVLPPLSGLQSAALSLVLCGPFVVGMMLLDADARLWWLGHRLGLAVRRRFLR